MKFLKTLIVPALLVTGLLAARPAAAQDGATRIATANLSRILSSMQETKDKNKAMEADRTNLNAQGQQKLKELQEMAKQRDDFLKKGTPDYNAKTNELLKNKIELQVWEELKKAEMNRRHKEEIKALVDKIEAAIAQVATEKKIDLVVADMGVQLPEDLEPLSIEQFHAILAQRNVLFTGKGVDISADVLAKLDAAYKK